MDNVNFLRTSKRTDGQTDGKERTRQRKSSRMIDEYLKDPVSLFISECNTLLNDTEKYHSFM